MQVFIYSGAPTVIRSDINIRSMGPISESDMVTISYNFKLMNTGKIKKTSKNKMNSKTKSCSDARLIYILI